MWPASQKELHTSVLKGAYKWRLKIETRPPPPSRQLVACVTSFNDVLVTVIIHFFHWNFFSILIVSRWMKSQNFQFKIFVLRCQRVQCQLTESLLSHPVFQYLFAKHFQNKGKFVYPEFKKWHMIICVTSFMTYQDKT